MCFVFRCALVYEPSQIFVGAQSNFFHRDVRLVVFVVVVVVVVIVNVVVVVVVVVIVIVIT